MSDLPRFVKLVEVGPRDGLQNEKSFISTETKVELVQRLTKAGFLNIEAAAFVSPKWVPQMADASQVMQEIRAHQSNRLVYSALTPNLKGAEMAIDAGVTEVVIFTAASEAFAQRNINCSIQESMARFAPVIAMAKAAQVRVRGSISCAFVCPYQGAVSSTDLVSVAQQLNELGCDELDIADTIGAATLAQVKQGFERLLTHIPAYKLAGHFHDTYGQALVNIYQALQLGISIFHTSVAGLGGCPYAPGASGNVATEDVLFMLHGLGIETGVNLSTVVQTGVWISEQMQRPYSSRAGLAIMRKDAQQAC